MRRAILSLTTLGCALAASLYACGGPEGDVLHALDAPEDAATDTTGDGTTGDAKPDIDASTSDGSFDAPGRDADADVLGDADAGDAMDAADACTGKDLDSDPAHCGACFHDCLGGPCSGGRCGPTLLATVASPAGIAVDSDHVYFASVGADAGVYAMRKDGSGQVLIAGHLSFPERVAVTGSQVLYTTVGTPGLVGRVETDGGAPATLAVTNTGPLDVASNGTDVFFVDQYSATIRRTTMAGEADGGKGTLVASAGSYPWGIALTTTDVVWTSRGTLLPPDAGGGFAGDGRVRAVSLVDGGGARDLASGLSTPLAIAADGATVYWVNSQDGTVMRLDDGASSPVTIATGLVSPWGIVLDARFAYVTCLGATDGSGVVVRVAKDGSSAAPDVLAQSLAFPSTIAVDGLAVYWTNTHGSSVMKVAK